MAKFKNPKETAEHFGIGEDFLARLRATGNGPFFRRLGHRTILYDWEAFELWLETQPGGGQRIPELAPGRTPRRAVGNH